MSDSQNRDTETPFCACPDCTRVFKNEALMRRHRKRAHDPDD